MTTLDRTRLTGLLTNLSLRRWCALSVESLLAYGPLGLFLVAFTESTVFPIPPDVILLPLAMMNPRLSWWYAFLTSAASVLGALVGYFVGRKAGRPVLRRFFKEEIIQQVEPLFVKYGGWAVGIAAFTPIPFKVFTFGAGIFRVPLLTFTVVSIIGRSARFFLEGAMVYFLGDRAAAYLGTKFEIATLAVTAALLLGTWLLPRLIPSGKKEIREGAPPASGAKLAYLRTVYGVRGLGTRALAWGTASAILGIFSMTFIEDVAGPERATLNAALSPLFAWSGSGGPSIVWSILSSVWVMGALAIWGLLTCIGPKAAGRRLPVILSLLVAVLGSEALIRWYLPGAFGPVAALLPYLPAIGIYLLDYRPGRGWRKIAAIIPAGAAATAMIIRSVADGVLDPASAALSLLCSAFMFCLTMSALTAKQ